MSKDARLPSWRPGTTRDALTTFLDEVQEVPVERRVACFDNDGTLWCERPTYVQLDFFLDALRRRVAIDAAVAARPELAALLDGDRATIDAIGLPRIAMALAGLFEGLTPEEFGVEVRTFLGGASHPTLDRPTTTTVYQPMLELIAALRGLEFTVGIVTGGGTEFVRAISNDLYGVPAELVVGTPIAYHLTRGGDGAPEVRRGADLVGVPNEGSAKITNIQSQLGRRPILAAGNSSGDREMLEWTGGGAMPSLALLVDHDDAEREHAYTGRAETLGEPEPIGEVAARLGWTVVSIARDWATVFPDPSAPDATRRA